MYLDVLKSQYLAGIFSVMSTPWLVKGERVQDLTILCDPIFSWGIFCHMLEDVRCGSVKLAGCSERRLFHA